MSCQLDKIFTILNNSIRTTRKIRLAEKQTGHIVISPENRLGKTEGETEMSTVEYKHRGPTRVLGRRIGRELTAAELACVAGGSGRTGPDTYGNYDTDYS